MDKTSEQPTPDESATVGVGEPGRRLITYNLLNSALACTRAEHHRISLPQLEDLCTLVDLFCFYDGVVLLGHNWKFDGPELAKRNDLAAALAECDFIREVNPWDLKGSDLNRAHAKHLAAFLGQDIDTFEDGLPTVDDGLAEDYVEFSMGHRDIGNVATPTDLMDHLHEQAHRERTPWDAHAHLGGDPDDWSEQMRWVRTVPERSKMVIALKKEAREHQRMHKFIMRTFVYVAYADVLRMPFIPDTARHPVIEGIVSEEDQFRGRLQSALKSVVVETTPGDKDLLRRVPPLAAVLFERARTARDIVPELVRLRNELAPLRETLRNLERQMLYELHDTAIRAATKWDQAVEEVECNFGLEPRFVTLKLALKLGEHFGETVDNPTSFNSWWAALAQLPAKVMRRLIARRTLIELHRLRPELPASERLRGSIQRIFRLPT